MIFYHQGQRKTNDTNAFTGSLVLVALVTVALIFVLVYEGSDPQEYIFELLIAVLVGISLIASLFRKRGKIHSNKLEITDTHLKLNQFSIPIENLILDLYYFEKEDEAVFSRYHLRDSQGKIALYSVHKDDLLQFFKDKYANQIITLTETNSKHDGPSITVISKDRTLHYDLDSGAYKIIDSAKKESKFLPEVYTIDGKYKIATPLKKDS